MRVGIARPLAVSSDLGLMGEYSSQKFETPCLGRRWTAVQYVTPLSLSSAEKSVTVQTNTQLTLYPHLQHLAYRHVWIIIQQLSIYSTVWTTDDCVASTN